MFLLKNRKSSKHSGRRMSLTGKDRACARIIYRLRQAVPSRRSHLPCGRRIFLSSSINRMIPTRNQNTGGNNKNLLIHKNPGIHFSFVREVWEKKFFFKIISHEFHGPLFLVFVIWVNKSLFATIQIRWVWLPSGGGRRTGAEFEKITGRPFRRGSTAQAAMGSSYGIQSQQRSCWHLQTNGRSSFTQNW